jgi:type I protein arginine methyltransferase
MVSADHGRFVSTKDWDNVYGLDFGPVKSAAVSRGFLKTPGRNAVVTQPARVLNIDLQNSHVSSDTFKSIAFRLIVSRTATVHAFLAWFDYSFTNGHKQVHVSTGPFTPSTHWKQTVFYLESPISMQKGEAIIGQVSFEQHERDLNVRFLYELETNDLNGMYTENGASAPSGNCLYKV